MKIAIVGYGKMGREIQTQSKLLGISVAQIIRNKEELACATFQADEVAIEFTSPEVCLENVKMLLEKRVPMVCGTTGWLDDISQVEAMVKNKNGTFLYASNFSIGVHLFWRSLRALSKTMNSFPQYHASIRETHHTQKKDKPSGTAKTCADIVIQNIDRMKYVDIDSVREGNVVGDHHIVFDSEQDTIELAHKAKNRSGFALGAIACAQWLLDKNGFFTIDDYLQETLR